MEYLFRLGRMENTHLVRYTGKSARQWQKRRWEIAEELRVAGQPIVNQLNMQLIKIYTSKR